MHHQDWWFSNCGPWLGVPRTSVGNLVQMQFLGIHPGPPESELLGGGSSLC